MERAPLRPVPGRPAGPVDPDAAVRHVAAELPGLEEPAARALALTVLAGRPREELDVAPDQAAELLARARKELRRALLPLPGSGWCERAERLVSDRLDGLLEPPGPARLDAHMRNCPRCVEHERALVKATGRLADGFAPPPAEGERERAAAPRLEVVPPAPRAAEPGPGPAPPGADAGRSFRAAAAAAAWNGLFALAVLLAVATVAIAVLGVTGAEL